MSKMRAKKQLRHVLQQNKDLACALEAARARILQLESGKERHDKVYGLCLPQIKAWTEDNVKQVHTILENSLRSIRLVADILTPSQDLTLAEDGDDTGQELLQRSLHPPGSRLVGCPDLMDVEEEEEEGETDVAEDGAAQETQIPLSSKVTVRSRRRRYSSPPPETSDEEAAVSPPRLRMSSYASSVGAVQTPPVFQHSESRVWSSAFKLSRLHCHHEIHPEVRGKDFVNDDDITGTTEELTDIEIAAEVVRERPAASSEHSPADAEDSVPLPRLSKAVAAMTPATLILQCH
ncbi:nascent polypeptide-associated complex subunit alpha, muscle-specific form [Ixodes scapularis]